jgi:hypothetical protein
VANVWYCDSSKYAAVTQWSASTVVSSGNICRQFAAPAIGNERCFVCTTGGTTAASEPTWNLGVGATTTESSGVVWKECTGSSTYGWSAAFGRYNTAISAGAWTAAGDTVYLGSGHAETYTTPPTITLPLYNNNPVGCVGVSNSAAPPTALATSASLTFTGTGTLQFGSGFVIYNSYVYGMSFVSNTGSSAGSIQFSGLGNGTMTFESCTFQISGTSSSSQIVLAPPYGPLTLSFVNCSFLFGATSQNINVQTNSPSPLLFEGGSVATTGSVPTTLFALNGTSAGGNIVVRDMDLSAITGTLVSYGGTNAGGITFENCKLGAGVTIYSGTVGVGASFVKLHNCDSGATNYRYYYQNAYATVISDTTEVRTNGATNGSTAIAWKIVTTALTSIFIPFFTEEIAIWCTFTSGTHTATICLAANVALTNGQVWAELEFLGASGFPIGSVVTSKNSYVATATTLTTDTSTWGGAPTNIYKIVLTFNPLLAGPVKLRIAVAAPSTTVWIDPLVALA